MPDVNDNAIFLSSFFSTEFDSIFLKSADFSEINSMLCDKDGKVIYADGGENKRASVSMTRQQSFLAAMKISP